MRTLVSLLLLIAPAFLHAGDKTEIVRELAIAEAKFEPKEKAKASEPTKITSKEELAKAIPDKDTTAGIANAVDFEKEYILLFQWAGSGGDKLLMTAENEEITFSVKRGLTKDLRQHAHVLAVAKGAKWSFGK